MKTIANSPKKYWAVKTSALPLCLPKIMQNDVEYVFTTSENRKNIDMATVDFSRLKNGAIRNFKAMKKVLFSRLAHGLSTKQVLEIYQHYAASDEAEKFVDQVTDFTESSNSLKNIPPQRYLFALLLENPKEELLKNALKNALLEEGTEKAKKYMRTIYCKQKNFFLGMGFDLLADSQSGKAAFVNFLKGAYEIDSPARKQFYFSTTIRYLGSVYQPHISMEALFKAAAIDIQNIQQLLSGFEKRKIKQVENLFDKWLFFIPLELQGEILTISQTDKNQYTPLSYLCERIKGRSQSNFLRNVIVLLNDTLNGRESSLWSKLPTEIQLAVLSAVDLPLMGKTKQQQHKLIDFLCDAERMKQITTALQEGPFQVVESKTGELSLRFFKSIEKKNARRISSWMPVQPMPQPQ